MKIKFAFPILIAVFFLSFAIHVSAGTLPPTGLNNAFDSACGGTRTLVSSSPTDLAQTTLPSDISTIGKYCVTEITNDSCKGAPTTYETDVYSYAGNSFTLGDLTGNVNGQACSDDGGPPSTQALYDSDSYPSLQTSLTAAPTTIYTSDNGSARLTPQVVFGGSDVDGSSGLLGVSCTIDNGVGTYNGTNAPFSVTPSSTTTYTMTCNYHGLISTSQATVTVVPPLTSATVMCSVSPASPAKVNLNQSVTWTAVVTGGKPPLSYLWSGDGFLGNATGNPVSGSYSTAGVKSGAVQVTDSSSQQSQTTVTENQNNDQACSGTNLGFIMTDVDDGDDNKGYGSHNEAASFPELMYWDQNFGPEDFHANPQNYCVDEMQNGPRCQMNPPNCVSNVKAVLYSGSGLEPAFQPGEDPSIFQAATWTVTDTPSSGPAVVTQMCSNTVNVTGSDVPPAPVLICPTSGVVGQALSFQVSGTDPGGEQVNYGGDWNDDQVVDTWEPSQNAFVPSGTTETFSTTSPNTPGIYTFEALTQNTDLEQSAWASCQVPITNLEPNLSATIPSSLAVTTGVNTSLPATIGNAAGAAPTGVPFDDTYWLSSSPTMSNASDPFAYPGGGSVFISGKPNGFPAGYSETIGTGSIPPVTYTFPTAGTYYMRVCTDEDNNWNMTIPVSDPNNLCSGVEQITVTTGAPAGISSCSVSNSSPDINVPVTYTATPGVGAVGPYTWNPSNSSMCTPSTGTTETCTYTIAGPYTMTVAGSNTSPLTCAAVTAGSACTATKPPIIEANGSTVPILVEKGKTAHINWDATNAGDACTVSGPGVSAVTTCASPTGASNPDPTITTQSVYTITCPGGTAKVIVNVASGYSNY